MKPKVIVYKFSPETNNEMITYFQTKKREKTPPYAVFQADEADTVVTLYESGKVMFQGTSADIDAAIWRAKEQQLNKGKPIINLAKTTTSSKLKNPNKNHDNCYQQVSSVGSDEVGTGDYFGPIIVTAAYVNKKDIPFLTDLNIKDSKLLSDEQILKVAPPLIKKIPHSIIILNNKEYNQNHSQEFNLNKIKAILHNKALTTLIKKGNYQNELIVIDQFVNQFKYYDYLKEVPTTLKGIRFVTKAEQKYYSVACAAIISRYLFLKEMKRLSTELEIQLPKGAGNQITTTGKLIVEKYGTAKLSEIAKLNFKNTSKILPTNK